MRLRVLLPTEILVDEEVLKVVAEAENGSFGLLPRHIDFAATLVPGILAFEHVRGGEEYVAVDEGVLVKAGADVMVSTRSGVRSRKLEELHDVLEQAFSVKDERERAARSASARLEADLVRRLMEMARPER
jgi:F-type H+-transporting ATPase subunit epsilon